MSFDFEGIVQRIKDRKPAAAKAILDARDELYNSLSLYKSRANDGLMAVDYLDKRIVVSHGINVLLIEPLSDDEGRVSYKVHSNTMKPGDEDKLIGTLDRHSMEEQVGKLLAS